MSSPFPGMDPYLESHWRDIHAGLIIYCRDALQGVLPNSLRARVEERVVLETPEGFGDHPLFPDVRVIERTPKGEMDIGAELGIAIAEPLLLQIDVEPATETFIEIIDASSGNRVVTIIEFLSPSNKVPGPNRDQYLRKQREICSSDTSLVEINLNRFGTHTLAFPLEIIKPRYRSSYMACVRRPTLRGKAEIYLMPLGEHLPIIKIPLRPTDADVHLDLQALIDQCYRNGGYEGTINYKKDAEPPLFGTEMEWADKRLREKGLRPRKKPARRKSNGRAKKR